MDELLKWQDLEVKLTQAFSPAIAISRKDFFKGRLSTVRRVMDAVNQPGQHLIIYGERGVGKTSLANVISLFLEPFTSEQIISYKVNGYRESSFDTIWRQFFDYLSQKVPNPFVPLNPNEVLKLLPAKHKVILIVDEFDRIEDPDIDAMFADTIKALSDFEIDATLVVVGVADDVDDLIAEHQSIDRCTVQVHLQRMEFNELMQIVEEGMDRAEMSITKEATTSICIISLGLPHYTHALSLAAGRAAVDRKSTNVESRDVNEAIDALLRDSQQTIISKFDLATASPRRENFYSQVLLACALAPTDHMGRFRAADVRAPYSAIMKKRYEIPGFSRHLHDLTEERRGAVLQKFGEAHNFRFRFTDPLMQPFVLMHGLKRGLIGLDQVNPSNS